MATTELLHLISPPSARVLPNLSHGCVPILTEPAAASPVLPGSAPLPSSARDSPPQNRLDALWGQKCETAGHGHIEL